MPRKAFVVIVAIAAAAALWFGLVRSSHSAADAAKRPSGLLPAGARRELPDLRGPTLSPPPAQLGLRLPGRPEVISIWASWCLPCREEAPSFARLAARFEGRVRFVGVDVQDTRRAGKAFVRRYRLTFPSIFDQRASLADSLGFFGVPTTFVVDRQGRIAQKIVGKAKFGALGRDLARLAGGA